VFDVKLIRESRQNVNRLIPSRIKNGCSVASDRVGCRKRGNVERGRKGIKQEKISSSLIASSNKVSTFNQLCILPSTVAMSDNLSGIVAAFTG